MGLSINDTAPDFVADTTQGRISFHDWIGPPAEVSVRTRAVSPGAGFGGPGLVCCDVSGQVRRKAEALSAYRSQFPLEPGMFPQFLLTEMFGWEYFVAAPAGQRGHPDGKSWAMPEPALTAPPSR